MTLQCPKGVFMCTCVHSCGESVVGEWCVVKALRELVDRYKVVRV